jgi:hypothetical protein
METSPLKSAVPALEGMLFVAAPRVRDNDAFLDPQLFFGVGSDQDIVAHGEPRSPAPNLTEKRGE